MKHLKILTLLSALALSAGLQASWTFSFKLTYSGPCPTTVNYSFSLPSTSGLPKKANCDALRAQILAIRQCIPEYGSGGAYIGDCCIFYTCAPCSGQDDEGGGPGSPGGSFNSGGAAAGQPFFSSNANTANKDWKQQSEERIKILGGQLSAKASHGAKTAHTRAIAPSTGHKAFDSSYARQMSKAYLTDTKGPQGTKVGPGDERSSDSEQTEFKAAGTDEAAVAQPIGGAGVTQGQPDTPPPPNPASPVNARLGICPKEYPYYNNITKQCYASQDQCLKNNKKGGCLPNPAR